jgi:hypothetical protein
VLATEDVVAIHELLAMYGHIIDARQWDRLDEVFLPDFAFYSSTGAVYSSLDELRAYWQGGEVQHPAGHHVTNIVLTHVDDHHVDGLSRGLYVLADSRVITAEYRDVIRRTDDGWRLASRRIRVP